MKLRLRFGHALCYCEDFSINGVDADSDDFGEQHDLAPEDAEPYGCGDMHFTPKQATQQVLDQYNITPAEYSQICEQLEEGLSFGACGWCV